MNAWDHAAALYARAEVERTCLELQDVEGQCVPLILWRLWTIDEGRAVDGEALKRAVALARAWTGATAAPLRAVRRALKPPFPPIADAARAALRDEVAAAELAAERILLETLDAMTPGPAGAEVDRLSALRALAAQWGAPASEAGLRRLILAAQAPLAPSR